MQEQVRFEARFWVVQMGLSSFQQDIPVQTLIEICDSMKRNTVIKKLSLVATRSNDPVAHVSFEAAPPLKNFLAC